MTQNSKHNNKKEAYLNCLRMTALILGIIFVQFLACYVFGIFKVPNTSTTPKSSTVQNSISDSNKTQSSTRSAFTNTYNENNTNNSNHTTSATVTNKVSEVKSNTNKTSTNYQATIIANDNDNSSTTNQKNVTNNTADYAQKQSDSTSTGVIYYQCPRLYAKPNPHSTILISSLECGMKVTILGYSDEYYHVNVDGQTGYIYYKFIDMN